MTRIMFWNVEKFSFNKIANPSNQRQVGAAVSQAEAAAQRLELMIRMVQQANPDILAIVEVATGGGPPGTAVNAKGVNGARSLLNEMRARHDLDWNLVPPLRTSGREGVAVFYRRTKLIFSGPYRWSGGGAGGTAAPGIAPGVPAAPGIPGAPYGGLLNGLIRGNRVVPLAAWYNVGAAENLCAAQTAGWTAFPMGGPVAPFLPREPYLTTFAELGGPHGGFLRDIAIFSIHSPANALTAGPYLQALAATNQVVGPGAANEVRVVAGDFNVNLIDRAGRLAAPYEALLAPNLAPPNDFTLALAPPPPPPPVPFPAAGRGYYATHIMPRRQASFWAPNGDAYPGYGYIGSGRVANLFAIDNMFVRGSVPANVTILNPVVGSPFIAYGPGYAPPAGMLTVNRRGGLPTPAAEPPAPAPVPNPAAAANIGQKRSFRGWANYGRIRSTSDHLPIVVDV